MGARRQALRSVGRAITASRASGSGRNVRLAAWVRSVLQTAVFAGDEVHPSGPGRTGSNLMTVKQAAQMQCGVSTAGRWAPEQFEGGRHELKLRSLHAHHGR